MDQILYILPRGVAIGILISAPMGPIGMFVIQRTLSNGRKSAFFTGVGAAFSDLVYCLLTGFCLSFITGFIETYKFWIQIVGGIVLAIFGLYLFRKNPTRALKKAEDIHQSITVWKDIGTGFLLTFSNPLILFFIIGLFSQFDFLGPDFLIFHYIWAYITLFAGAILWWYLVTLLVNTLRTRFNVRSLWLVNRIIGSILIGMAIIGVIDAFFHIL